MMGSFPTIVNYSRKEYAAGAQNWSIGEVPDGTMLFGNHYGLLTFNSREWNLHGINYGSAVRALLVDTSRKRVYAGGSNEFGYFHTSAKSHRVEYVSITATLKPEYRSFGEIWNIMQSDHQIWFQADTHIICNNGSGSTRAIKFDKKITSTTLIDNIIYVGFDDGTLSMFNTENPQLIPLSTSLGSRICSLLPLPNGNLLIVTSLHGIFIFDGISVSPCLEVISSFLKEHQAFCATLRNGILAVGTVNCGAVVCRTDGTDITYINKSSGLQNNTVLRASFDSGGNLWLCLDNGLACVAATSPIRNLLGNANDHGAGYASMKRGNRMLLGTNQGLYSTPWPTISSPEPPRLTRLIRGQIWAIDTISNDLFVCGDLGLYMGAGETFMPIQGIRGATSVTPLLNNPEYALVSTYEGFYLMHNSGGQWKVTGKISGYTDSTARPVEDKDGTIWLAHWQKGIYRMKLNVAELTFENVKLYTSQNGLPDDRDNLVQKVDGKIVFSTTSGFYTYSRSNDSIIVDERFGNQISGMPTSRLYRSPGNDLWMVGGGRSIVVNTNLMGDTKVDSVTYRAMGRKLLPGSENLNFLSDTRLIAGHEDGFFDIDLRTHRDTVTSNKVFVSALYANQDSLLYNPELFLPESPGLEVPYSLNSVRFEFVAPDYSSDGDVVYSVCMEGLSDEWSQYSPLAIKEYTSLHEGEYTFRIKAYNRVTGATSECSFALKVLPPWYRSLWAMLFYAVASIVCIYFIYRLYIKKSHKAALIMEKRKNEELAEMERINREESIRKDYEIAQLKSQQLEQDIKNKSNELSNSTLNLVRKNEILLDISERLSKLSESLRNQPDDSRNAKAIAKIKELIRENISHDDDWKTFTRNFDLVYENYMQRLLEVYPMLTLTDQRLCAYIKMGLSSKEIAPLLNITYRSVEMTRYRLRKKMNLSAETSLSDYLRKF